MSRKRGFNFANIKEFCKKYKCELLTQEDELNETTKILKIKSSCGHEVETTFNKLFKNKKGIYCDPCFENIKINGAKCLKCDKIFIISNVSFCYCSSYCSHTFDMKEEQKQKSSLLLLNKIDEYINEDGTLKSIEEIEKIRLQKKINKRKKQLTPYENVKKELEDKNCKLLITEKEFDEIRIKHTINKAKLKILSSCGHESKTTFYCFKYQNIGIVCKKCNNDKKTKADGEFKTTSIEKDGVALIKTILKNLDVQKTRECCEADICVKPKNVIDDSWLNIQLKTSLAKTTKYNFSTKKSDGSDYKNMPLLFVNITDKRFWLVEPNKITVKRLNLAKYNKNSKYNEFEVKEADLEKTLLEWYNKNIYNTTFYKANTPQSKTALIEYEYTCIREEKVDFIKYI